MALRRRTNRPVSSGSIPSASACRAALVDGPSRSSEPFSFIFASQRQEVLGVRVVVDSAMVFDEAGGQRRRPVPCRRSPTSLDLGAIGCWHGVHQPADRSAVAFDYSFGRHAFGGRQESASPMARPIIAPRACLIRRSSIAMVSSVLPRGDAQREVAGVEERAASSRPACRHH